MPSVVFLLCSSAISCQSHIIGVTLTSSFSFWNPAEVWAAPFLCGLASVAFAADAAHLSTAGILWRKAERQRVCGRIKDQPKRGITFTLTFILLCASFNQHVISELQVSQNIYPEFHSEFSFVFLSEYIFNSTTIMTHTIWTIHCITKPPEWILAMYISANKRYVRNGTFL